MIGMVMRHLKAVEVAKVLVVVEISPALFPMYLTICSVILWAVVVAADSNNHEGQTYDIICPFRSQKLLLACRKRLTFPLQFHVGLVTGQELLVVRHQRHVRRVLD